MVPSTGIEPVTFPMSRAHRPLTGKFLVDKMSVSFDIFCHCPNIDNGGYLAASLFW